MLLTVSEDRAMLRSNPSADIEVSGKGDAEASLFFCINARALIGSPFPETSRR
jgi:hypothetical protein